MKKEIFLHKLDLFTLSLEILTSWNENKDITQNFYTLHHSIRNQEHSKKQNFVFLIKYIYNIILITNKYHINRLANKIIKDEKKSLNQYLSKFLYTYYKNKKYYVDSKFISYKRKNQTRIATKNDAILQLYIIGKLDRIQGIYKLIKYLK